MGITVNSLPAADARVFLQECRRVGLPTESWYRKANSYSSPLGSSPGIAWLLMLRGQIDGLDKDGASGLTLKFGFDQTTIEAKNMMFVDACRLSGGADRDKNALYLVQLADKRWTAAKYGGVVDRSYNVPKPGDPNAEVEYYHESKKAAEGGGSEEEPEAWTWETMLTDLWKKIGTGLVGEFPGMPEGFAIDGTPQNFRFLGMSAYEALNVVLQRIGCALRWSHTAHKLEIVEVGAEDSKLTDLLTKAKSSLVWDDSPIESNRGRYPEKVVIYFRRRDYNIGENDDDVTWIDHLQQFPIHSVEKATNKTGAIAGTRVAIWDDMAAVYQRDGELQNESQLESRASERSNAWVKAAEFGAEKLHKRFTGIFPFSAGARLKLVTWRNYGDGYFTEIWRQPGFFSGMQGGKAVWSLAAENLQPPDLARAHLPNRREIIGVLDESLVSGGSATLSIWHDKGSSNWEDSEKNETVHSSPIQAAIPSGRWVRAWWNYDRGVWMADQANCP